FSGGSIIAGPSGDIRARAPLWDETLLTITLDPEDLTRARSDVPLLTDLQTMMPHLMRNVDRIQAGEPFSLNYDDAASSGGSLTPKGRGAGGERADAPSTEESARTPGNADKTRAAGTGRNRGGAKTKGGKADRNGIEPIPVVRAPD